MDDLHAEPLIARWIRTHVAGWKEAVVVSKNAGGTKRVTSMADALKLNFGLVTTDRRRATIPPSMEGSGIIERFYHREENGLANGLAEEVRASRHPPRSVPFTMPATHRYLTSSPLVQSARFDTTRPSARHERVEDREDAEEIVEEYNDERARDVITGRLIHGHIVDDSVPSPALSAMSYGAGEPFGSPQLEERDPMALSYMSNASAHNHLDPTENSDEEKEFQDPAFEHTVTLVGNVKDKIVLIIDDMIDQAGSWVAAAETVVKRGYAKKVYCIATHGLFGDDSLEQMEACDCIDHIVVTNTYPLSPQRVRDSKKLVILDISYLLSEAIRRNHYGESMSSLFQHYPD